MPNDGAKAVREVTAWYTETVRLTWTRPKNPDKPMGPTETLTVELTAPPLSTWDAKRNEDA